MVAVGVSPSMAAFEVGRTLQCAVQSHELQVRTKRIDGCGFFVPSSGLRALSYLVRGWRLRNKEQDLGARGSSLKGFDMFASDAKYRTRRRVVIYVFSVQLTSKERLGEGRRP